MLSKRVIAGGKALNCDINKAQHRSNELDNGLAMAWTPKLYMDNNFQKKRKCLRKSLAKSQ